MKERREVRYKICEVEHPISVRGVYHWTLGIGPKYGRMVSTSLTQMRRDCDLPQDWITDPERTPRPNTWDSVGQRLALIARNFRRTPWIDADHYVEIWSEASSMVGVLWPVADEWDVYMRPVVGFSSERPINAFHPRSRSVTRVHLSCKAASPRGAP